MAQPPHRARASHKAARPDAAHPDGTRNSNSPRSRNLRNSTTRGERSQQREPRSRREQFGRFYSSARATRIHWLEYATGVLVVALLLIQAFRPGVSPRIDPRALLPAIDPIGLGRAAFERFASAPSEPVALDAANPVASAVAAAPATAEALPAEPTRANIAQRRSGYVEGYAQLDLGGSSVVTIDNRANDADVFVNLVRLGDRDSLATRVVIVAAGDSFNITGVQRGRYELRYRDLLTGILDRTDPFVLTERRGKSGVGDGRVVIGIGDRR